MVVPDSSFPGMPLLALDAGADVVRAVVYMPGRPLFEQAEVRVSPSDAGPEPAVFWEGVCAALGTPRPEKILLTLPGSLEPATTGASCFDLQPLRRALVQGEVREENRGVPLGAPCFWQPAGAAWATDVTPSALAMDAFCAHIHGALALPALHARTQREGLVLVNMGGETVSAALIFQNRLFGYMAVPASAMTVPLLLEWLEAFRLGWLPPEKAEAVGGCSFVCIGLPAEAEGFRPVYVLGENAFRMKAHAQLLSQQTEPAMLGCRGLVCGYGIKESNER